MLKVFLLLLLVLMILMVVLLFREKGMVNFSSVFWKFFSFCMVIVCIW